MSNLAEALAQQLGVTPPEGEKATDKPQDTATETEKVDNGNTVSENEKKPSDDKADDKSKSKSDDDKKTTESKVTDTDKDKEKSKDSGSSHDNSIDITADDDPDDKSTPEEKIAFWKKHSRMWERKARAVIKETETLKKKVEDNSTDKELQELRAFKASTVLSQEKAKLAEKEGVDLAIVTAIPGNIDEVKSALKALKAAGAITSKEAAQQRKPVPTFGKQTDKPSTLKDVLAQQIEL